MTARAGVQSRSPEARAQPADVVNRFLGGVAVASVFLAPLAAAATPTPSPALDTVLVAPADPGFADDPNALAFPEGIFTAPQWAAVAGTNAPQVEDQLHCDGFITGYARAWLDKANNHIVTQAVVAFSGGKGAGNLLTYLAGNVTNTQYFSHAISVSGIDSAGGAHFANPAGPVYADQIWFTKGNDYFYLAVLSPKDDMGDLAPTQAKRQFDVAPAYTIPPAQWPENTSTSGFSWSGALGSVAWIALAVAAVVIAVVIAAVFLLSRQRPAPAAAYASMSWTVQMSADGNYWWDGAAWRDASRDVPPSAQRSGDGYYWWDGRAWRLVPKPPS